MLFIDVPLVDFMLEKIFLSTIRVVLFTNIKIYLKSHCILLTGIEEIRKDIEGNDLPNARRITRIVANSRKQSSTQISTLFAAFGQFVDHDMTDTPIFKSEDGDHLDCCAIFPLKKVHIC